METSSALLAICAGNSPVPGEFHAQRPVTRSFDVFFDLRLNKRLSKQSWGWWFETLPRPLCRHSNVIAFFLSCFSYESLGLYSFSIIRLIQIQKAKLRHSILVKILRDAIYLKHTALWTRTIYQVFNLRKVMLYLSLVYTQRIHSVNCFKFNNAFVGVPFTIEG